MIKIYHNPRCSKSREAFNYLEASNKEFEVIKYLENKLSEEALTEIITLLNIPPIDLIRKNEPIWKENFKGKKLDSEALIKIMVDYPKLIERPIVIFKEKAVICRPLSKIEDLLRD